MARSLGEIESNKRLSVAIMFVRGVCDPHRDEHNDHIDSIVVGVP